MTRTIIAMVGATLVGGILCGCSGPAQQNPPPGPPPAEPEPAPREAALTAEQLEEVQRTVKVGMDAISSCYEDEMERRNNTKFSGKAMVKMVIGTNRKAETVEITESTIDSEAFDQCVILTIKGWEFPRLPKAAPFSYPFQFEPAY